MFFLTPRVQLFFTDAADMRCVAELRHGGFARGIIVAFIQTQVLRRGFSRLGPLDDNGIERQGKQLRIWSIGPADAGSEGPTVPLDQQAFLDARLATVTGIGANTFVLTPLLPMPLPGTPRALPRQPSAACQCQSTPCRSSHLVSRMAHKISKMPFFSQRTKAR
jgi:hypothetical protein